MVAPIYRAAMSVPGRRYFSRRPDLSRARASVQVFKEVRHSVLAVLPSSESAEVGGGSGHGAAGPPRVHGFDEIFGEGTGEELCACPCAPRAPRAHGRGGGSAPEGSPSSTRYLRRWREEDDDAGLRAPRVSRSERGGAALVAGPAIGPCGREREGERRGGGSGPVGPERGRGRE